MSTISQTPKVALVYDWVDTHYGGAEVVLDALHEVFPDAPLFTSIYRPDKATWAKGWVVVPSFLNSLPTLLRNRRIIAPLLPLAFETLDLSEYEIVISITSAFAKSVITKPNQLHICYLLTPPRFLYTHHTEYKQNHWLSQLPFIRNLTRYGVQLFQHYDTLSSHRPDAWLCISEAVAKRAEKNYKVTPQVVYPPVVLRARSSKQKRQNSSRYLLLVSRLVEYKKIELAIRACENMQKRLLIIGDGPAAYSLKSTVTRPDLIEFKRTVSLADLSTFYSEAEALLMPGVEDFGIVGLEALDHGLPVIVHAESGVAELIQDGITGIHVHQATVAGIEKAVYKLNTISFNPDIMKQTAKRYSVSVFKKKFERAVTTMWRTHSQSKGAYVSR